MEHGAIAVGEWVLDCELGAGEGEVEGTGGGAEGAGGGVVAIGIDTFELCE